MSRYALLFAVLCVAAVHPCRTQNGVCYLLVSQLTSQAYYTQTSYTYYYSCGLFGWRSCAATGYSSTLQYRSVTTYSAQFACCSGYAQSEGQTCIDIDECAPNGGLGPCQQLCTNTAGSFLCGCRAGYILSQDGRTCQDVNECSSNGGLGPCQQLCTNTAGSFYCSCQQDYLLRSDNLTCDLDECHQTEAGSPCEHNCTNTDGSFYCNCTHGYVLANDSRNCLGSPLELELTAFNSTALIASWLPPAADPNDGILQYYQAVCTAAVGGHALHYTFGTDETRAALFGVLLPYMDYGCCVRAVTTIATGPFICRSARTHEDVPYSAPVNLTVSPRSATEVDVFWGLPSLSNGRIVAYNVYFDQVDGSMPRRATVVGTSVTISQLVPHQVIRVQVSANTSVGEGPLSAVVEERTLVGAPVYPPRDLSVCAECIMPQRATVTWSIPFNHDNVVVNYYELVVSDQQFGTPQLVISVPGSVTSYTFQNLQEYCLYHCEVSAGNDLYGLGPSSNISFRTLEDAPSSSPLNFDHELLSFTSCRLFWEPPPSIDQNGVIRNYSLTCTSLESGEVFNYSVTNNTMIFANLEPLGTYECRVAAVTVSIGPYTVKHQFKMSLAPPTSPVQIVVVTPLNSTSVLLVWKPPSLNVENGVILYYMVVLSEPVTMTILNHTITLTSLTVGHLLPYYIYSCTVGMFTAGGSIFTEDIQILSYQGVPSGAPQNIIANATSPYDVLLSWQPPLPAERNGVVLNYTIVLLHQSPDSEPSVLYSQETSLHLYSLLPHSVYNYSIGATTSAGTGPFSDFQQVTTLDEAVNISLSQVNYVTSELAGRVEVCAKLLIEVLNKPVSVIVSTEPGTATGDVNYTPLQNYGLNLSPGMRENETVCVNITIIGDNMFTDDKEFYIVLSTSDPAAVIKEPHRAVIVITNSDAVKVSLLDSIYYTTKATGYVQICAYMVEGALGTAVHINLSINSHSNVSLDNILGISSLEQQTYQVLFQLGQKVNSTSCANITLSNSGPSVHWEEFNVYLNTSNPNIKLISPYVATVVVTDQDNLTVHFSQREYRISESAGCVNVCTQVFSGHVERPTDMYVSTVDMSATGGIEYTSLQSYLLLFTRGYQENDCLFVTIEILHNNVTTGTRAFGVLLLDSSGGVLDRAVIRIEDSDFVEVGFDNTKYIFFESTVSPMCVTIYSGQLGTELALKLHSSNGSAYGGMDYFLGDQKVVFNRSHTGGNVQCVNLTIRHNSAQLSVNKTFDVSLSLLSDDVPVHFVYSSVTVVIVYEGSPYTEATSTGYVAAVATSVVIITVIVALIPAIVVIIIIIIRKHKGAQKRPLVLDIATHTADTSCAIDVGVADDTLSCDEPAEPAEPPAAVQHNDIYVLIASTAM